MEISRKRGIARQLFLCCSLVGLLFMFSGCSQVLNLMKHVKNGKWDKDEAGNIRGCVAGGTECFYGGATPNGS